MGTGFSTLGTAMSGLRASRAALDVAANNVANAGTEGYVRRRLETSSVGAPAVPALWSRYDGQGEGVRVDGVQRMTDELLTARVRREHGTQSYLDVRSQSLGRIEGGLAEPGENGLAAALTALQASWQEVSTSPTSSSARSQVLQRAEAVVRGVAGQVAAFGDEAADQRVRLQGDLVEANGVAANLAQTNEAIAAGHLAGTDVNSLLDARDGFARRLAELTGASTTIALDGTAQVSVGGTPWVAGAKAGTLAVTAGITPAGDADGRPVALAVTLAGATTATGPLGGEVGGITDVLDHAVPDYLADLSRLVSSLADKVNAQHRQGFDADGNAGGDVFTYDPADVLGSFAVAVTDGRKLAVSAVPGGGLGTGNGEALARTGVSAEYSRVLSGFGTTVADAGRRATVQKVVTGQADTAHDQLAGVSTDEEMVAMVSAQRAFEAASRVMTAVDSMLDTLINRTGLVR